MAKSIGIHFFGFEDIFSCYRDNRDLKHQQRNGMTMTGRSKIFPREGAAHV